jgi:hypothetical protein
MRKLVHRGKKLKTEVRCSPVLLRSQDTFFLIEIQNTSGDTSLNFIFRVQSHCSSVSSSSSCKLSKFCDFGENSIKGSLTQSYISDDKEGKYWSRFFVSNSK